MATGLDIAPLWSWSDGSGFFAAFFAAINKAAHPNVNVNVVFKPSGDIEESIDVTVV